VTSAAARSPVSWVPCAVEKNPGEVASPAKNRAAVHRSGQDRAEPETSRPGVRVGSAHEAVLAPCRRGERADPAPDLRADECGKLVDRIVGECVVVHERTGERSAEKCLDAATPQWSQIIATGFRAVGCAEQMAVYRGGEGRLNQDDER
jgi:hypothetical protein